MYTITTERLLLREITDHDIDSLVKILNEPKIRESILEVPRPFTDRVASAWIDEQRKGGRMSQHYPFGVSLASDGEHLIGYAALTVERQNERARLQFCISEKYCHQRYATESVKAVIDFGFSMLGIHLVSVAHLSCNKAAGRVLEKAGLLQEGQLRDRVLRHDSFNDITIWSTIQGEWQSKGVCTSEISEDSVAPTY
ncbi:MAG: GNAT family N-acetyltransferase [Candidatus Obscuribacterales bacterium]|nr:GNAT family N-acetyltransferase [Candidatus Obscuribacterales bacterium]